MPEAAVSPHALARRVTLAVVGILAVAAIALWLAAAVLSSGEAAAHAQLHAVSALGMLAIAGVIAARWGRKGIIALGPALGLVLFAASQLVEGLGALGYAADNSTRASALADLHDVGLALTGPAMLALLGGVAIAAGMAVGGRGGRRRWVGVAVALVILVPGVLFIKTTIGL